MWPKKFTCAVVSLALRLFQAMLFVPLWTWKVTMFTAARFAVVQHRLFRCRVSIEVSKISLQPIIRRRALTKRRSVGLIAPCERRKSLASKTGPSSIKASVERTIGRAQAGRISQESQAKWQSQVCLRADATAVTGPVMNASQNALDGGQGLCMASLARFVSPDPQSCSESRRR